MQTDLAIRPALPSDDDALWAMLRPVFRAGDTYAVDPSIDRAAALAVWQPPGAAVWIAEGRPGARALGTAYLKPNFGGPGAHVANAGFVTDPAARGRGVARALRDHVLAEARARGFRAMQFNCVVATNAPAIRLWREAGFETVATLPGAFRHPVEGFVDALVMFKSLTKDP